MMHRFYADPERSDAEICRLSADDAKHALTVLRLKTGTHIEMIHSQTLWEAEITDITGHDVCARLLKSLPSTEPSFPITLFQGLPKSDKMDWIVQKATEIGVSRIVPLNMARCVVRYDHGKDARKLERWERIIRESCKQCARSLVPEITAPCDISALRNLSGFPAAGIVAWEEAEIGYGPRSYCEEHPRPASLGILIGPEGGIEKSEIEYIKELGFTPVTLGKRILRTETAGLAAVSAILGLYGELDE